MELPETMAQELIALNAKIWDYAELKFEETRSAQAMIEVLERHGFTVQRGVPHMPTAYIAEYGSGKPIIGILAEYDALSGLSQVAGIAEEKSREGCTNGHGCGHCLLGTAAVGAGLLLKSIWQPILAAGPCGCTAARPKKGAAAKPTWPGKKPLMMWMRLSPGIPGHRMKLW